MEKRSIHAKKRVSIYTLMSYVSHVYKQRLYLLILIDDITCVYLRLMRLKHIGSWWQFCFLDY